MELIEIKGLFEIDYGAPSPTIFLNDNELLLAFYSDKESLFDFPQERNAVYDMGIYVLKFKRYIKCVFGIPGDETLYGHPYSKLGMKSCKFYELRNSDLIKSLQDIEKVHPGYRIEKWEGYKHYILTFHDNMFECVAENFEVKESNVSIYSQMSVMLEELFAKHF